MDNSADGSDSFPDLLSAALSESGLTDDLQDVSSPQRTPIVYQRQIPQQIQQSSLNNLTGSPFVGGSSVTPRRIIQNTSTPMRLHTPTTPQSANIHRFITPSSSTATPTTGNVRKIVVHAVRPKSLNFSGQTGQKVLVSSSTATTGQAIISTSLPNTAGTTAGINPMQIIQSAKGPVRIIRVGAKGSNDASLSPAVGQRQVIRLNSTSSSQLSPIIGQRVVTHPTVQSSPVLRGTPTSMATTKRIPVKLTNLGQQNATLTLQPRSQCPTTAMTTMPKTIKVVTLPPGQDTITNDKINTTIPTSQQLLAHNTAPAVVLSSISPISSNNQLSGVSPSVVKVVRANPIGGTKLETGQPTVKYVVKGGTQQGSRLHQLVSSSTVVSNQSRLGNTSSLSTSAVPVVSSEKNSSFVISNTGCSTRLIPSVSRGIVSSTSTNQSVSSNIRQPLTTVSTSPAIMFSGEQLPGNSRILTVSSAAGSPLLLKPTHKTGTTPLETNKYISSPLTSNSTVQINTAQAIHTNRQLNAPGLLMQTGKTPSIPRGTQQISQVISSSVYEEAMETGESNLFPQESNVSPAHVSASSLSLPGQGLNVGSVRKIPQHISRPPLTSASQQPLIRIVKHPDTNSPSPLSLAQSRIVSNNKAGALSHAMPSARQLMPAQNVYSKQSLPANPSTTLNPTSMGIASSPAGNIKGEVSGKAVCRIWANEDIKLKKISSSPALGQRSNCSSPVPMMMTEDLEDEVEEEDQELGQAETYADYMPAKLKLGLRHPDPVVETSSLSSVEPPNVHYKLSLPEHVIDSGSLSALQLETIVYASQKHDTFLPSGHRGGFLIGDGAGVGKGRTVAGIIYENYLQGRKRALWLSVSSDLRVDAVRDLTDIGAGKIEVHPLNKFKYAKISSRENGSVKKGVIFATYSSLIGESQSSKGKYRTRFKQLLHWLGKTYDGPIVFDECHKAKNLCPVGSSKPTKTGRTVLELQSKLPKARIIYASATGASEPRNMAYMTRIGLWGKGTPFPEFNDFIQAVEKRGVGAMELVAMDMKLRGTYIARQLSFKGVAFRTEEIPVPKDFHHAYNQSVQLWVKARERFQQAAEIMDAEHRMKKTMWGQFWSAHQRFFKYLCISAKVPHCVKLAREAIKNGKCVVIGLQSTGEARTLEQLEESGGELTDFVSTAKGVFQTLVEKHFPAPNRRKTLEFFGLGTGIFDESPVPSPKQSLGKRKREADGSKSAKKLHLDWMGEGSDDGSSDSSSDDDSCAGSDDNSGGKPEDDIKSDHSELSLSESDKDGSGSDNENFNPFGGSDSDDDPWLKKKSVAANKKKSAVAKKTEDKPEKVHEKISKKKKKHKKKHKRKQHCDDESEDEFGDMDKKFDKALEAAGLKSKGALNNNSTSHSPGTMNGDAVQEVNKMKQELLDDLERIAHELPPNTLDELIDSLGGTDHVAEMTGRKGRVVSTDDGQVQYESRSEIDVPLEILNLTEKQRFMDGEKDIAIISEAASSGISLQADRRANNQKRRVHITLELPWSADRAIQQFGRTHRSNQVSAPEYVFLISELAGENRFASTVAKRLESLGALTHGDRRATETRDLSRFNIDNKYGRAALEAVMKSVLQIELPFVPPPRDYSGNFFEDVKKSLIGVGMIYWDEKYSSASLEKDYNNISKFLNRILGITVNVQNYLFKYFTSTLAGIILQAKRNGHWDLGILDLGSNGERVQVISTRKFAGNFSGSLARTELHTVSVERGLSWQQAVSKWRDHSGPDDGFYVSLQERNGKRTAVLAVAVTGKKKRERLLRVYRPSTGMQPRLELIDDVKKKYRKAFLDDAQSCWDDQYEASATICSHAFWKGYCRRANVGLQCETGLRSRIYYVLGGSVLGVWNLVESVLVSAPGGHASRIQIIRMRTDQGKRIVGTLIPVHARDALVTVLTHESNKSSIPEVTSSPAPKISSFGQSGNMPRIGSMPNLTDYATTSTTSTSSKAFSSSPYPWQKVHSSSAAYSPISSPLPVKSVTSSSSSSSLTQSRHQSPPVNITKSNTPASTVQPSRPNATPSSTDDNDNSQSTSPQSFLSMPMLV